MKRINGTSAHTSGHQSAVTRIVIHGTVSPCAKGGAVSVAHYFQSAGAGGSAQYVVDPFEVVQCYDEHTVCWHAPPNQGSIGIELCDPQKGSPARWKDANHEAMLVLAAKLVRQVAARWNVPLRRLSVADLRAGKHGICGHVDVAQAWHQSDHTDPGTGFPWDHFMDLVHGGDKPEPEPTWTEELVKDLPTLEEGDDNFDVKTLRWNLGARDVAPADQLDLLNTKFTPALTVQLKSFQKAKGLKDDGICGPATWPKLLRL